MKKIIAVLFFILPLIVSAQTDTTITFVTFAHAPFSFQHPQNWELDTSGKMNTTVFAFSPKDDEADNFRENVSVIIQDLAGSGIDLEKYASISEEQMKTMVTDCTIHRSEVKTTPNGECYQIQYDMTQGTYRIQITSYCFIQEEKAYLITFATETKKAGQYKSIGEQILNSFSLDKN